MILQKVQAPGLNSIDSFIDFTLNAKNTIDSVKNKKADIDEQVGRGIG